jgi:hypothetical protein
MDDKIFLSWVLGFGGTFLTTGHIRFSTHSTELFIGTYPEYYNTDDHVFFDVTQVMFDPESYVPYKFMLFRHIEDGNTVQGQRIYSDHPMYNFPDVI